MIFIRLSPAEAWQGRKALRHDTDKLILRKGECDMKWQPFVFAACLVLVLSYGASAEFYQYKDEDGNIRYTDDATIIPEEQLPDVITYESVQSAPAPETTEPQPDVLSGEEPVPDEAGAGGTAEDEAEAGEGAPPPVVQKDKMEKRKDYDELNAMREDLQKAYIELEAEKKAVGAPPPPGAKTGEMADYAQKRKELGQKIDAYNKRSEAFDEKVKAFNKDAMQ